MMQNIEKEKLRENYQDCMQSAENHMNYALSKHNRLSPVDTKELEYWKAQYNQYKKEYDRYQNLLKELGQYDIN